MEKYLDQDYANGWRYIVWVGGNDDYYKNYNDAKRDADEWIAKGYDDVIIEEICNAKGQSIEECSCLCNGINLFYFHDVLPFCLAMLRSSMLGQVLKIF